MLKNIYLDNAATMPVDNKVLDAMLPYLTSQWHNPNSLYKGAVDAKNAIEKARSDIAEYIGASASEIYFTSGGSESNNWAIQGFVNYWSSKGYDPVVMTTPIEHDSVLMCVRDLSCETEMIPVNHNGFVKQAMLYDLLEGYKGKHILISVHAVNNEIGVRQNIRKIALMAHGYGALLHVDAVQESPNNLQKLISSGADMVSVSGHKFGAPKGIGFLYIKDGVRINPLIYGHQNNYMRGGTENVPYIVGMATALLMQHSENDINVYFITKMKEANIRFRLNTFINNEMFDECGIFTKPQKILNITLCHNVTAGAIIYLLDSAGIQISAGSACNAHEEIPSHVLTAIGVSEEDALRTIRISFSPNTTESDVDMFVNELARSIELLSGEKLKKES